MKRWIILFLLFSKLSSAQNQLECKKQIFDGSQRITLLLIQGLKDIRHDRLMRLEFREAHRLKLEILQLEKELNNK